jgi:hypothetical protein
MLSDKHGIGLAASDLDFSVIKPEADYADEYISGTEAQTTIAVSQASPTVVCKVRSSEGFTVGRRVDVNFVANTCAAVVSDNEITLGTAVTQTINQIVRQIPRRFEAHLLIDSVAPAIRWIERILAACRGYITYDAGRIQLRIERDTVKERLPNGDFELWSSSTNADSWTEDIAAGGLTVNRDGTIKSGGSFSLRLDRTVESTFGGVYQSVTGLEPGRWYRITFQHKQDALGIGTACRLFILNVTKGLYLDADGITWGTSRRVIDQEGATAFTQYEVTFKVREDFALTDAIRFALTPNFTAGHSVWYDDVHVRGPYAGDFREFTTGLNMGWAENTFRWSLDSKDRETNRVSVRFLNQSGRFGDDEVAANDFVHQRRHYVKTKEINGDCFSDRDQAARICQLELAKIRQLGPGCEFLGTPAALALQPGDVILVSDTVPGWSCKEQRVLQTEVDGLGKDTEHFVTVRTEDYLESVYPDTGPPQQSLPIRPSTVLTVTVVRHTGSVLELAWSIDTDVSAALYFRIHSSATPGFAPNHLNMIGQTSANGFVYTAAESEIEEVRYYRVVAVTDYGPGTMSAEFTATIFAVDYDATDGTHGENNADGNMIYDSDFQGTEFQDGTTKNGDGWLTNSNVAYTDRDATVNLTPSGGYAANGSDLAFTSPANAYDNNLTTYAVGTATWINISSNDNVASVRYGFAAGTRTGRVKLRGKLGGSGFGYVQLRYSVSGTGGPWINFAQPLSTTDTDYVGPRLVGQNMANFFIEAIVYPRASGSNNSTSFSVAEVDFQEETAGAIYAHMVDGHLELKGDGTNYAEARRRFPGKSPPANGTYLTTSSPNRWEIKAQTLSASAPSNPLEIRLEDALTGRVWAVASVAAADVAAAWWGFTNLFDPGAFPVAGSIDIVIRTKDANGIRADQVLIKRERVITSYQVGSEDQQLGRFPDLRLGEAVNWPKGKLVVGGAYRKILVA